MIIEQSYTGGGEVVMAGQRLSLGALIETTGDGVVIRLQFPQPMNISAEKIVDDMPDLMGWKWGWSPRSTLNKRGQIILVSTFKSASARTLIACIAQRFRLRPVIDEMPFPADPELAVRVSIISAIDEQVARIKLPHSTTPVQEQLAIEMLDALFEPYADVENNHATRTTIHVSSQGEHLLKVVDIGEKGLERRLLSWAHALGLRYDRLDSTQPFTEHGSIARACNL